MNYPNYTVVPEMLSRSELHKLRQLTSTETPQKQWYGRQTYWNETFEPGYHKVKKNFTYVIDKMSAIFLEKIEEMGENISNHNISLEISLDLGVSIYKKEKENEMFWHRDAIEVDQEIKFPQYSMVLLLTRNDGVWNGGDFVLQKGGRYAADGKTWENSRDPMVTLVPKYNQAVIFRNDNSGHKVTALIPKKEVAISRYVAIITCFFRD